MRKRKFYICLMALLAVISGYSNVFAQESVPSLLLPGRVWNFTATLHDMRMEDYNGEDEYVLPEFPIEYSIVVGEERTVGGQKCTRLYTTFPDNAMEQYRQWIGKEYYVVEEGHVLSFVDAKNSSEATLHPLLDFSLAKNDEVLYKTSEEDLVSTTGSVIDVDTIVVKGRKYKRLSIGGNGRVYDYWVEGIGSCIMNFQTSFPAPMCNVWLTAVKLVSVYDGNELIFEHDDFATTNTLHVDDKDYTTGLQQVTTQPGKHAPTTLFDLQGRRLQAVPERGGVFIRDGRKVAK